MNSLDLAITKLESISKELDSIAEKVTPYAIDLKRAELRLGIAPNGLMPPYSSVDYYNFKKGLSTYKAGGKYDLFLSGKLHKGIEATEEKGIIKVGNSAKSPDYAYNFTEYTEGISDKGAGQLVYRGYIILLKNITDILHV